MDGMLWLLVLVLCVFTGGLVMASIPSGQSVRVSGRVVHTSMGVEPIELTGAGRVAAVAPNGGFVARLQPPASIHFVQAARVVATMHIRSTQLSGEEELPHRCDLGIIDFEALSSAPFGVRAYFVGPLHIVLMSTPHRYAPLPHQLFDRADAWCGYPKPSG